MTILCDTMKDWALANGSGTLRQAVEWGMAWKSMALHERLAMEVATMAEAVPATRLNIGIFKAEGDDSVTTELGWYARTLKHRLSRHVDYAPMKPSIKVAYFHKDEEGGTREGAGLIVEGLKLDWFPAGHTLLIPLAYWDLKNNCWVEQANPL